MASIVHDLGFIPLLYAEVIALKSKIKLSSRENLK